jgi:hypothetical protein
LSRRNFPVYDPPIGNLDHRYELKNTFIDFPFVKQHLSKNMTGEKEHTIIRKIRGVLRRQALLNSQWQEKGQEKQMRYLYLFLIDNIYFTGLLLMYYLF